MKVSDIYLEVQNVIPYADEATIFSRLSDAVECLANKGLIDAMQGFIEIPTTSSRIVTLPRDIEVPIKVNVGDNPSFSRTKLYEFTMNGPGSAYTPTDWGWEDRGDVPVLVQPAAASTIRVVSTNAGDTVAKVYVSGRLAAVAPNTLGREVTETLLLNGTTQVTSVNSFASITRIVKDVTLGTITLSTTTGTITLSIYAPDETEPQYRQIKLSKSGTTAHILFRRSVYRISTQNDWIPIQSRMGLYLMLRANEMYRKGSMADMQTAQALEKQAESFVNEEQKSRNAFAEIASQTENDSATGRYFTDRDSIIVADIYDEAAEICGPVGQNRVFDRITEAIEALSNKAQWDAMTSYVDITVASGNTVTLPREVEIPIKVNINGSPSFSKDRLYEFTLNGPGSTMTEVTDFSWMDRGNTPITGSLTGSEAIRAVALSASDNGKFMTVHGKDSTGRDITDTLTIHVTPTPTVNTYSAITRVVKDVTVAGAELQSSTVLSKYYPDEIEPSYRRIVLSKTAPAVRIMFRKSSMRVRAMSDLIPLQSRAAIVLMMRSFAAYRSNDPAMATGAKAAEAQAVALLQDEQKSRNLFSEFTANEIHPIEGLNINNRDSIIVSDIYDEAVKITGQIGRPKLFDKLTDALEVLANKGQWEGNGLEGYVDITSTSSIVTLPRYVDYPLAINIGKSPSRMRNKWFEFHLNGPGSECSQICGTWTDLGDVVTLSDLEEAHGLTYKPDSASDNNKTITVYGYDENDKWIMTNGVPGFTVTALNTATSANKTVQKVKRVERVVRQATVGFAQLLAYNDTNTETQLGYYYHDETEPTYRRIKIPCNACWVRMRYRKRALKITSLTDPLHLRSRRAILAALQSIEEIGKGSIQGANEFEAKAIQYLSDEKLTRNPLSGFRMQFDNSSYFGSPENGQF